MVGRQFLKFITVGFFSTVLNYAVFYTLYEYLSTYYVVSSAVGFIVGVFVGYGFNKNWTFGAQEKTEGYVRRYYLVYSGSLLMGLALLEFLVDVLGIVPEVANILIIGLSTCTNFVGTKLYVFGASEGTST